MQHPIHSFLHLKLVFQRRSFGTLLLLWSSSLACFELKLKASTARTSRVSGGGTSRSIIVFAGLFITQDFKSLDHSLECSGRFCGRDIKVLVRVGLQSFSSVCFLDFFCFGRSLDS